MICHSHAHHSDVIWALNLLTEYAQEQGDFCRALALPEEALALSRAVGDALSEAHAHLSAGDAAAARGTPQEAAGHYQEALLLLWSQGDRACSIRTLIGLAHVAVACLEPVHAAEFLATADALDEGYSQFLPSSIRATAAGCEQTIRSHLGEERFACMQAATRALSPEKAVAAAIPAATAIGANSCGDATHVMASNALTDREFQVLRLVAEGRSNPEIAHTLFISKKTARNHVTNILTKLRVDSRTAAATVAIRHGMV